MRLYGKQTKAAKDHGPCASCPRTIYKGQNMVTLREFDPITKQSGRIWKRHADCKPLEMEWSRLSDARTGRAG